MPDVKSQGLAGGTHQPEIFASAAFDPPIAVPTRRLRIAAIAMGIASVIWVVIAILSVGTAVAIDLLLMALVGAVFDAVVALQLWQQHRSRVIVAYIAIRAILAAGGFIFLCLPVYLVALIAIPFGNKPPDPPETLEEATAALVKSSRGYPGNQRR